MTLTQNSGDGFNAGIGTTSVTDTGVMSLAPSNSLGTLTATKATDTLSGTLNGVGSDGKTAYQINFTGDTLSEVLQAVNGNQAAGITATLNKAGTGLSFTATTETPARPPSATTEISPIPPFPPRRLYPSPVRHLRVWQIRAPWARCRFRAWTHSAAV